MSSSIGRISLDLDINRKGFTQDVNQISRMATKSATPGFAKMGAMLGKMFAAAFVAKVALDFGKSAIGLASNLAEIQNVVDVTFGKMSPVIDEWAKTTVNSFGMGQTAAKKYSSTIGAMFKSAGWRGKELVDTSMKVAELAADFASFYNMDSEDAFMKIRSGLMGETEPLRMIGKDLSAVNVEAYALSKGITKPFEKMKIGEKIQLRMGYLLSISQDAMGDFVRTSGGWANQIRLLSENWKGFKTVIGGGLINLLLPIVNNLNFLMEKLKTSAQMFTRFVEVITGRKAEIGGTGAVLDNVATGADDAGDAVKGAGNKIKGALSNFDELNVIGADAASGLDALADGATGAMEIIPDVKAVDPEDFVLPPFIASIAAIDTGPIQESIANLSASLEPFKTRAYEGLIWFRDEIIVPLTTWTVQEALPTFFDSLRATLDLLNASLIIAKPVLDWWWTSWMKPIGTWIATTTVSELKRLTDGLDATTEALKSIDEGQAPLVAFLVWYEKLFVKPFLGLLAKIDESTGGAFTNALGVIKEAWGGLSTWFDTYVMQPISKFFDGMVRDVIGKLNGLIEALNKALAAAGMGKLGLITMPASPADKASATNREADAKGRYDTGFGGTSSVGKVIDSVGSFIGGIVKSINGVIKPSSNFPQLASGGLAYGPTLAMVGDNKRASSDPEVISPLSTLQGMMASGNQVMVEVLVSILHAIESKDPTIEMDGEKLAKALKKYTFAEDNRIGRQAITVGGVRV